METAVQLLENFRLDRQQRNAFRPDSPVRKQAIGRVSFQPWSAVLPMIQRPRDVARAVLS